MVTVYFHFIANAKGAQLIFKIERVVLSLSPYGLDDTGTLDDIAFLYQLYLAFPVGGGGDGHDFHVR